MTTTRTATDRKQHILNLLFLAILIMPLLCSLALFSIAHSQAAPPPQSQSPTDILVISVCRPGEDEAWYTISNQGTADLTGLQIWLFPENTITELPTIWPGGYIIVEGQRPSSIYVWRPASANLPGIPAIYTGCGPKNSLHFPYIGNKSETLPAGNTNDD